MKIQITKEQLKAYEKAQAKLDALESGGVDNWEFYDEAMTEYKDTVEKEEKLEQLLIIIGEKLMCGAYEPSERGAGHTYTEEAFDEALDILKSSDLIK